MSIRLEWSVPEYTGIQILKPGKEAPDGQYADRGNYTLLFGDMAIEGSLEEFETLLKKFQDRLRKAQKDRR